MVGRKVTIIGAGPAGLMAAEVLAAGGASVSIFERMPSAGRKFLLAGRGGLNLTHSEALSELLGRYGAAGTALTPAIEALSPDHLRQWSAGLGQDTFVGTSGRVFPLSFKASPLLRAWLRRLSGAGVTLHLRHHWIGWDQSGGLLFDTPNGRLAHSADAIVLALGGASWPRLGSDGVWVETLAGEGIAVAPLQPANCGFVANWSELFRTRFAGQPLKRIVLSFGDTRIQGEAMITEHGLEGSGIYALSAPLRDAIAASGAATLSIALRPDVSDKHLRERLERPRGKQSLSTFLRKSIQLQPAAIGLLHEAAIAAGRRLADLDPAALADLINAVPIRLTAPSPLANAISTAGGVAFGELDPQFMVRRRPGLFVAGEMLDWEAPTGGYLLQASLSTGAAAGRGALAFLAAQPD